MATKWPENSKLFITAKELKDGLKKPDKPAKAGKPIERKNTDK